MECKDCIHYDVCATKDEKISLATKVKELVADNFTCFKNKADFVEVVRCAWCKYFDAHPEDLYGTCELSGEYLANYEFCSYGERKKNDKE